MDDELKNMLVQIMEGQEALKIDFRKEINEVKIDLRKEMNEVKNEVRKLGNKIDGEISEKLKILCDEQSVMRKEISEINLNRMEDREIIEDIKLSVDALYMNQEKQGNKIIELDKKLAK